MGGIWIALILRFCRSLRGLRSEEGAASEKREAGASVHSPFEHLRSVNLPLRLTVAL